MTPMITVCAMPQESEWYAKHTGYLAHFDAGSGAFMGADKITLGDGSLEFIEPSAKSYRAATPKGLSVNNQAYLANGDTSTPYLSVAEVPVFMLAIAHNDFLVATSLYLMRVVGGVIQWKNSYRDGNSQGPNNSGLLCALVRSAGRYYAVVKTHLRQGDLASPSALAYYREIDLDNDSGGLYSTWPSVPMPADGSSVLNGYEVVGQIWPGFEYALVGYPGVSGDGAILSETTWLTGPATSTPSGYEMSGTGIRFSMDDYDDVALPVVVSVRLSGGNVVSKTEAQGAPTLTKSQALARLPAAVLDDMAAQSTAPYTGQIFSLTVGLGYMSVVVEKVPFWTNHRRTQETL